jgi:ATP-dependent 26S proteasome regulatory subunit
MALVDRDKYKDKVNLACMSNILNFSDGIIGSLIDVRIIVTTNYLKKDLDKAILRNGRLLTCIECNYISYEQCETIWNKNIDKFKFYAQEELDKLITREYTLANIYELINFCKREGRMKNEQDKD